MQARNRRCSKIKQKSPVDRCTCTPVYKFNIDESIVKVTCQERYLDTRLCVFARSGSSCVSETWLSVRTLFTQNRTLHASFEFLNQQGLKTHANDKIHANDTTNPSTVPSVLHVGPGPSGHRAILIVEP